MPDQPESRTHDEETVRLAVDRFLHDHTPGTTDPAELWGAEFDAGLAWVHFAPGSGGLGVRPGLQDMVNQRLRGRHPEQLPRELRRRRHRGTDDRDLSARRNNSDRSAPTRCSPARRSGASCSASRARARISRR